MHSIVQYQKEPGEIWKLLDFVIFSTSWSWQNNNRNNYEKYREKNNTEKKFDNNSLFHSKLGFSPYINILMGLKKVIKRLALPQLIVNIQNVFVLVDVK